ncbi:hypothetical protein H5968_05000 [Sphaerospermopsis sp. LEGE 00249]|nr:hypothetical protein [Sphaerospermopsis sp. LEGE 00249]
MVIGKIQIIFPCSLLPAPCSLLLLALASYLVTTTIVNASLPISTLSCYTAKLYNPNILNSCLTGKMPVPLVQIKCTTAYFIPNFFHDSNIKLSLTNLTKLKTLLTISDKGFYIFFRKK